MNKIIYYFIFGCFILRLLLSFIVKNLNIKYYYYISGLSLIIGLSFLRKIIFNKKNERGFFGNKTWWKNYRIIHSFNYLLVSFLTFKKNKHAWKILLIDAFLGLFFFINNYSSVKILSFK